MTRSSDFAPLVLIDEASTIRPYGAAIRPERRLIQPPGLVDWSTFDEVTFILSVAAVVGEPTSWSMTPRLQYAQAHTAGNVFRNLRWFDVDAGSLATDVAGGAFFPAISTVGTWKRTVRNFGKLMRVNLGEQGSGAFTMTGGTNPGLTMSLIAYPKRG